MSFASRPGDQLVAIVDVGSNTAKLCVYALRPGEWVRQLDELRSVVRLAAGMGKDGEISAAAFERGIEALAQFGTYLRSIGVHEVRATATSAVRAASNGAEFLAAARERAGIELEVLTGEQEAAYGALAVANSFAHSDMLVLDVGGGSAQLTHLQDRQVTAAESWPLGVVVTTERFFRHDPPLPAEVAALRAYARQSVAPWLKRVKGRKELPLVGMGGTVRNLANLDIWSRRGPVMDFMHGHVLKRGDLTRLVNVLLSLPTKERGRLEALSSDRADIIAAGAVVVDEVLRTAGAKRLLVSGNGLREGLLAPYLLPGMHPPLVPDVRRFSVDSLRGRVGWTWPPSRDPNHVADLALAMYDVLPNDPSTVAFERELLAAAARLHDVGRSIDFRDQHKHGYSIIMSEPLPGYSLREQSLIALQVRYQRSGKPGPNGLGRLLAADDVERLRRLTGVLRLAVALDRSGTGYVREVVARVAAHKVTLEVRVQQAASPSTALSSPELTAAKYARGLLAEAYGLEVAVLPAAS